MADYTVTARLALERPIRGRRNWGTALQATIDAIDEHAAWLDLVQTFTEDQEFSAGLTLPAQSATSGDSSAMRLTATDGAGFETTWTAKHVSGAGLTVLLGASTKLTVSATALTLGSGVQLSIAAAGAAFADAANIVLGSTNGTKWATATSQKQSWYNATPITQATGTTDLRTLAINMGWLASGGATPLNLNGGALTVGSFTMAAGATAGYVLTSNGSGVGTWQLHSGDSLATLTDVTITSVADKNLLEYDSGSSKWKNVASLRGLNVTDAYDINFGSGTGTKLGGSGAKLALYNATPVTQATSTSDLRTVLVNIGAVASGGATPLNLNGGDLTANGVTAATGVFTSTATVGTNAGGSTYYLLNGAAGASNRDVLWTTAGVARWFLRVDASAESGSNAGSNLSLLSRDDAGAGIATIFAITRSSGLFTWGDAINQAFGTGTGTKLGTATAQKFSGWNATPIAQQTSTTDLRSAVINFGLISSGGATPLNLNGGTLTAGGWTSADAGGSVTFTTGTTNGTIFGSGSSSKMSFWGAAAVTQTSGNTDILAGLVTIGLRAASANPPLNLGSGALTAGSTSLGATTVTTLGTAGNVTLAEGNNVVLGTVTGTKIGTATSQLFAHYNSTAIAQSSSTSDIRSVLVNQGFIASGGATPLNLNGGDLTAANVTATTNVTAATLNGTTSFTAGTNAGGSTFYKLNGAAAASNRDIIWTTAGVNRWFLRVDASAESGSNAGSNLMLLSRADDGTAISTVLTITRSSGLITLGDAIHFALGTGTGTKWGTGTTQLQAFYNATPVSQATSASDIRTALINWGVIASGGATPLNLNGGALTAGSISIADGGAITIGTSSGSIFGASGSKIGVYGNAAVARPAAYTQTFATTTRTHAARTAAALTDNSGGASGGVTIAAVTNPDLSAWNGVLAPTAAQATAIGTAFTAVKNAIATLSAMVNNGTTDGNNSAQVLNQMLDDDQLIGWKQ